MKKIVFSGKLSIIVKPNSKENKIYYDDDTIWVEIKASPVANKANIELIKFLKKLSKKNVRIVSGRKSRKKVVEFFD